MIELIGLLGGLLFAIGCLPIAYNALCTGKTGGAPLTTKWLLFTALILYAVYLFLQFGSHLPFWFLVAEMFCWGVDLWYHYFPRPSDEWH